MLKSTASRVIVRLAVLSLLALSAVTAAFAQPEQQDLTIDAATRIQVVDAILKRLNDSYVFPEVAKKMETSIRERVAKKEYDQITSAKQFATTLTNDLQAVSHDKHLRVRYSFESIPRAEEKRLNLDESRLR
jgi:lipoate-protein ligase A